MAVLIHEKRVLVLDASTKIPSGIFTGNIVDLGMFDECLSVSEIVEETVIRGRHCMYSFKVRNLPASITFSICLPSSCDAQDVKFIYEKVKNNSIDKNGAENWKIDAFDATCSSVDREISVGTIITMLWFQTWGSLYVFLAAFAVDTFFLISGFLMTYLVLKEMSNGKKFNIFLYYIHRYIRLTPVVGMLLLITIFILPHLGSGPIWEKSLKNILSGTCEQKWWTLLVYVQNYVRTDIECLGHTWYLAADMHFYWISPIILIPLMKKPKLGLAILGSLVIASLISVGTMVAVNGYISTLYSNSAPVSVIKDSFRFFYTVSHTRASSWLIGIYLGYIIHSNPAKLSKTSVFYGWLGAIGCFIFCIMGQRVCLEESYKYNLTFETTFAMFSRPMWAIGVAWVVFASIYGYGGYVTEIMSLPIFLPLSRISFCIYIVHATLQIAKVNTTRTADYFSEFQMSDWSRFDFLHVLSEFFEKHFADQERNPLEARIFRQVSLWCRKGIPQGINKPVSMTLDRRPNKIDEREGCQSLVAWHIVALSKNDATVLACHLRLDIRV
ncbi:nose resistant to fluoxetine protein 6-like [Belonocnema kinseyi]|uniref:nose resistant to fluoxetine protein 6-like n=1 Tax=Belonocnema kinseyi TaxID=2817044 RepID=UPI00143DFF21|nr:nose resistant to fluoxetine protein 6-like [Belonocnema kinseyi]